MTTSKHGQATHCIMGNRRPHDAAEPRIEDGKSQHQQLFYGRLIKDNPGESVLSQRRDILE